MTRYNKFAKMIQEAKTKTRRFFRRSLATYKVLHEHYISNSTAHRVAYSLAVIVVFISILVPIVEMLPPGWHNSKRYNISPVTGELIGQPDTELATKISYDSEKKTYIFNKDVMGQEITPEGSDSSISIGGEADEAEYAVEMPTRAKDGVKIYDSASKESVKLIPQFNTLKGAESDDRIVYPLAGIDGQKIYSVKKAGLKEDMVINKYSGDELSFSYELELPSYLEARMSRGSVGIYSADTKLFGNISYGSDKDQELIQKAREKAKKDHLLFMLPEPFIKENGNDESNPKGSAAHYELNGSILTVKSTNLKNLNYPITIDPSVLVTSIANFEYGGNNEGGTQLDGSNNRISRSDLTGGSVASWTAEDNLLVARRGHGSVAYNGYLYVLGGTISASGTSCKNSGSSVYCNDIEVSTIASDGTIGSFSQNSTFFANPRRALRAEAYNGYMYITGGEDASTDYNDIQYAPINTNGSIGNWTTSTNTFTTGRQGHTMAAVNGYVYVIGGKDSSDNVTGSVQYAKIQANGDVSAWAAASSLGTARTSHTTVVYNNYIYAMGGGNCTGTSLCTGANSLATVEHAVINGDGTLGTWATTTSMANDLQQASGVVQSGYIYIIGGYDGSNSSTETYYVSINADGTLGADWETTTNFSAIGPRNFGGVAYKGRIYITGGWDGTSYDANTERATLDSTGEVAEFNTESDIGDTNGRQFHGSVAYKGYLYVVGGTSSTADLNTVKYAAINTTGDVGAWSTSARTLNTARAGFGIIAYNDYLYVLGGCNGALCATFVNTIEYSPIGSSGELTANFTTNATNLPAGRAHSGAATYNGYVYLTGGTTGTNQNDTIYASIGSPAIGSWTTDTNTNFTNARNSHRSVSYGGYLYVVGGVNGASSYSDVWYAPIGTSGALSGNWASTTSMNSARWALGMDVSNGYLYAVGGYTGSGYLDTTEYAKINTSNGTVGSWTNSTTLQNSRRRLSAVAYNGYIYATGGENSSAVIDDDVDYAYLGNGGYGQTGTWTASTTFTTARSFPGAAAYNGYIYVVGGFNATQLSTVYYAPINASGTLGSWTSTNSMTTVRRFHTVVAYNGYLYALLGQDASNPLSSVEYVQINSNGSLGTWTTTTAFPMTRQWQHAFAYKGYMYVTGGQGVSSNYYAPINSNGTIGSWTATSSLLANRQTHASFAYNGYAYVLGGHNGSTQINTAEYAPINSDGTIGTWVRTTSFNIPRSDLGSYQLNGEVYILGGTNAGGGTQGDVQHAPINSNGTIGNWRHAANLNSNRKQMGYASYNGYFYMIGGDDGTALLNTTAYAGQKSQPRIAKYSRLVDYNEQSPGVSPNSAGSWTTNSTYFAQERSSHTSVAYNGYLYVIGGGTLSTANCKNAGTSTYCNDILYAPINNNGSVGSWTTNGTYFSGPRAGHSSFVYNGRLYVVGGLNGGGVLNDIQYATINSNGSVGSWTTNGTNILNPRLGQVYNQCNGYIYATGGWDGVSSTYTEVKYAAINAGNGSVGSWTTSGNSLVSGRTAHTAIGHNGYLYVLGGSTLPNSTNTVQYATLSAVNGSVGSWATSTSFINARQAHTTVVHNDQLYTLGGVGSSGSTVFRDDVENGGVTGSGSVGSWSVSPNLFAFERNSHTSVAYGDYLYVIGGQKETPASTDCKSANSNTYCNDVQYSKIQNIGNNPTPAKIALNGTDTGNPGIGGVSGPGGIFINYSLANNSCLTLGSLTRTSNGLNAQLGPGWAVAGSTDGCSAATQNYRYLWVSLTLDDSQTATFPDADSNHTTLTDIDFYYRANTAKRLRGGKTFTNEAQKSLDAAP